MSAKEQLRRFANAAAAAAVNITRPNYFDTTRKGETFELKNELNSDLALVRKEAVKKVIASMTLGKDVGNLFPDVLKNIQTDDLELKKLVYLYLMIHATDHPDLVILAINTFCRDARHPNALIRALAIRTMGCLRVHSVLDYLMEPLNAALRDESAYVRRTAATCVVKAAFLSPELVNEMGLVNELRQMVLQSESNAAVIAAAVDALCDISEGQASCARSNESTSSSSALVFSFLEVDQRMAGRLLSILDDCSEWGQVAVLEALSRYNPGSVDCSSPQETFVIREVASVIRALLPRLQHSNPDVLMSCVRVICLFLSRLSMDVEDLEVTDGHTSSSSSNREVLTVSLVLKKLASPLLSVCSSSSLIPEVQFVALKSVLQLVQHLCSRNRRLFPPQAVRVFFLKFNDPVYVKMTKVDLIVALVCEENSEAVLKELADYGRREVDPVVVRHALLAMARVVSAVRESVELAFDLLASSLFGGSSEDGVISPNASSSFSNHQRPINSQVLVALMCISRLFSSLDMPQCLSIGIGRLLGELFDAGIYEDQDQEGGDSNVLWSACRFLDGLGVDDGVRSALLFLLARHVGDEVEERLVLRTARPLVQAFASFPIESSAAVIEDHLLQTAMQLYVRHTAVFGSTLIRSVLDRACGAPWAEVSERAMMFRRLISQVSVDQHQMLRVLFSGDQCEALLSRLDDGCSLTVDLANLNTIKMVVQSNMLAPKLSSRQYCLSGYISLTPHQTASMESYSISDAPLSASSNVIVAMPDLLALDGDESSIQSPTNMSEAIGTAAPVIDLLE